MKIIFFISSLALHFILFLKSPFKPIQIKSKKTINVIKIKTEIKKKKKPNLKQFNKLMQNSIASSAGFVKNMDLSKEGSVKDKLYDRINEGLTFPRHFRKFLVGGITQAKLYFDKRGRFHITKSIFQSSNPYINYHVMSYLENRLKGFILKSKNEGLIAMTFEFKYRVSGLVKKDINANSSSFYFERIAPGTKNLNAKILNEIGMTLISLMNLLKFRPDFLKTNKELLKEKASIRLLKRIQSHPYYKLSH